MRFTSRHRQVSYLGLRHALCAALIACSCARSPNATPSKSAVDATSTQGGTIGGSVASAATGPAWPACSADGSMARGAAAGVGCSTADAAVNVVVDATQGPANFSAPRPITNALYSMGIDDHTRGDYMPSLDANFVAYLKGLHPGLLRFPAGVNGQHDTWSTTDGYTNMSPGVVDAFVALCRAVGAEPFLAVNLESAPMSDAIAMLTYANLTKQYGVKWWQIGNEPNLPGQWPNESPTAYPRNFFNYRAAMLQVDPNLKFVGLESYTGEGILGQHDEIDWYKPFLAGISSGQVDAIAWHYYPLYSSPGNAGSTSSSVPSVAHLLQEDASDWPPAGLDFASQIIPYMRATQGPGQPNAQIWIDEFAEDSGTTLNAVGYGDRMVGALWAVDAMSRYAEEGADAIFHFIFKATSSDPNAPFGYTLLDDNNVPRPEYYAIWLMANYFGDNLVQASSDQIATVAAHAAIRAQDCSLRVMLVNKGTTAQKVRLTLKGYAPATAGQYNVVGTGYQTADVRLNGTSLTTTSANDASIAALPASACQDNVVTVAPYSVNMFVFGKT